MKVGLTYDLQIITLKFLGYYFGQAWYIEMSSNTYNNY